MHGSPSFLPFAEIHLELGSVILVFSTLGISRSCAAILAYLMHRNEQTLKVCILWSRLGQQPPPGGGDRAGSGRNGAPGLPQSPNWGKGRGNDQRGELQVQGFTQRIALKA